jgi:integrase
MRDHITQKLAKRLQPPAQGNRIVYDGAIRGFGVRTTAGGAIAFILNYHVHGRERRFTIGRWPEMTAEMARAEALRLREAIRQGHDPLAERERARGVPTMADLGGEYLERHAKVFKRPLSIRDDRRLLTAIILPRLGRFQASALTRGDVENLHRQFRSTPVQANRVLALLSKMFSLAIKWGWTRDNPARGIARYQEQPRERWLKEEELTWLGEALDKEADQNQADALRVIMLSGARKGEVLSATWDQFDLERGVWTKPAHATKQAKVHHLPLNAPALDLLCRMRKSAGSEYLFPGRSGGHLMDLKKLWKRVTQAAGLERVHIHDLRHTFASHLVSGGVPLASVGALLGHTQARTTERYAHLADGALRAATDKFGSMYEKTKKGRGRKSKP